MDGDKLPRTAYELSEGDRFVPLTRGQTMPEFTLKAVLTGICLGIVFGAANAYLGLKAGLTISTSIPVAVLSVVVFRLMAATGQRHTILETNMSQTIGSASSSVASGAIFTLPALFMWEMVPPIRQMTLLAMSGGLIGILCMIPLRRYLIVREHGKLPYPEGMACAEVLVASQAGGKQAAGVFCGIGVGMFFKLITSGLKLVPEKFSYALPFPERAAVSVSVSPALIGVGYILGIRISLVMVAGGALSALILIPGIYYWGRGLTEPFYPEQTKLIADMSAKEIWNMYIRYIGAGAVATAGIITLIRSIPTMIESFRLSLAQMGKSADGDVDRTEQDLSFGVVLTLLGAIIAVLVLVPGILGAIDSYVVRAVAAVLVAIFSFFFVTVSSRIVGIVGQTSNPISGMTIASLLGTAMIFYLCGWTDDLGKATALMVGAGICIAASIAGDTSQDLKTGYILGATPRFQQIGELIGVLTSATAVVFVLIQLDATLGFGSEELPAPQGTLMLLVIDGVLEQTLPWTLIGIGVTIAAVAAALRLPALPFAVGVYLPLYTMGAILVGGLLRWLLTRDADPDVAERRRERGVLFGSGLVGGGGLTGVLLAFWVGLSGGQPIGGFSNWLQSQSHLVQELLALGCVGMIAATVVVWATRGSD